LTPHESVITFGCLLYELHVQGLGLVGILSRDLKFFTGTVLVLEAIVLHVEDVDETVESKAWVDRELDENHLLTKSFLEGVTGVVPVGLLGVELVDSHHHWLVVLLCIAGEDL
jgi:hypothetical protein